MPIDDLKSVMPLEQTGASQILLYLFIQKSNTEVNISELEEHVNASRETILRVINFLVKKELVSETVEKKFPFEHKVKLTEKGLMFAKPLVDIAQAYAQSKKEKPKENDIP